MDQKIAARVQETQRKAAIIERYCATRPGSDDAAELHADATFLARHLSPMAWERLMRCIHRAYDSTPTEAAA